MDLLDRQQLVVVKPTCSQANLAAKRQLRSQSVWK